MEAIHNLAASASIEFKPYGVALRKALKDLPSDRQAEVSLPLEVWEDLHLLEALEVLGASGKTATLFHFQIDRRLGAKPQTVL